MNCGCLVRFGDPEVRVRDVVCNAMKLLVVIAAASLVALAEDPPCPTDVFLDVAQSDGAGEEYARPQLDVECDEGTLVIRSNGIPHYEFVQITPNPLLESNREYRLTRKPQLAEEPTAIPLLGTVGVAINGIPFFGPNEGGIPYPGFGDPIFNSIMDVCMGHTAREYHYHALVEACLAAGVKTGEPSGILAFAVDGFPVFGPYGCVDAECGKVVKFKSSWDRLRSPETDSWDAFRYSPKQGAEYLDRCNGHSGPDQDGKYHYHITETWPYILGCFAGTPSRDAGGEAARPVTSDGRPGGGRRGGGPPPPDSAPTAEQVSVAAAKLSIDEQRLAAALRLTGNRVVPMNFAASARALGIELNALREALGLPPRRGRRGPPPGSSPGPAAAPGGQAPCLFRCGQSNENAVGCGLTSDHKVICTRPCDDNKCG